MQKVGNAIFLNAHDLVGNLNCAQLTRNDLQVVRGTLAKPAHWDPLLEILRERGLRHEQAYLDHLYQAGLEPFMIEGVDVTDDAVLQTRVAMKAGRSIIVQAALRDSKWVGRADILRRVEQPSALGDWSYEIIDTKLARETKGGTVLQLCLYAKLLAAMQGVEPEFIYVVAPWSNFEPQQFRVADYGAFFRKAQRSVEASVNAGEEQIAYPHPRNHCEVCRWEAHCDSRRRADDHLCLVANISSSQMNELRARGVSTVKALAEMPVPLTWKPKRGAAASYVNVRAQARIQVEARETGELQHELLDIEPGAGLCRLPEPSVGDVFLDLEGDPFIGENGFEYLFGYRYRDVTGTEHYEARWALDRPSEKAVFEEFVDFVTARRLEYPDMHIFHYAPYEPGALKRLMGRYATRQTEVDNLLRGKAMVDLYGVVRGALRASVESYSMKKLEPFYGFERALPLKEANVALAVVQAALELGDSQSIDAASRDTVAAYNRDDCDSAAALRDWLEQLRAEAIRNGRAIDRPALGAEGPTEKVAQREANIAAMIERLTHNFPVDPEKRTAAEQARWLLAHSLDWYGRENKAVWWEYFRLRDLSAEELLDEKAGLGGLEFLTTVETTKQGIPTDRYLYAPQDTDIRVGDNLKLPDGTPFGKAVAISKDDRIIEIKKTKKSVAVHPNAVFAHKAFDHDEQEAALMRIAAHVADNGIEGLGPYQAARDLLFRLAPRLASGALHVDGETTLANALRIAPFLDGGVLPVQGPPGTGKSFTGAHMIFDLVRHGNKRVGITANSHKVVRNLINKSVEVSLEKYRPIKAAQKLTEVETDTDHIRFFKDNDCAMDAVNSRAVDLMGGVSFFWARQNATELVDVLFVDEAAQMSLANVLAVSQAARQIVLLGDPQQLDQPSKGSHPDGTDVSGLHHVLKSQQTIAPEQGLFLAETWRMHPAVTAFSSELFYDGKLHSVAGCAGQDLVSESAFTGTGLRYVAVPHTGNKSSCIEEAEVVTQIVKTLISAQTHWTNSKGVTAELTLNDIIIIAPYNAQVIEIQRRIPGANVGTVDKFQGQEAAVAIYSLTTSSHADAPRGMEFLYSGNRLNVAISRAKCLAIMVASPAIFEAECRTPRQMQLANAFCRYLELAQTVFFPTN